MKTPRISFPTAVAVLMFLPGLALADVFSWTYGGTGDPVYASGTLTAVPDPSNAVGLYDITGGSGTRTDGTGTYSITIVPFSGSNNPAACLYSLASNCTVVAQQGGVGAHLIFDNLLFADNSPGSQLDGDGIVLSQPTGPYAKFYAMWSAGCCAAPPDQEFDPYFYTGTNLTRPFVATFLHAPEPTLYSILPVYLVLAFGVIVSTLIGARRGIESPRSVS